MTDTTFHCTLDNRQVHLTCSLVHVVWTKLSVKQLIKATKDRQHCSVMAHDMANPRVHKDG